MALFGYKDYGVVYSDDGEHLTTIRIKRNKNEFNYSDNKYVLDRKKAKPFERNGIFFNKRFYSYNINNPFPFLLDKKGEPIINTEQINILMETKVIKDINKLNNNWWKNLKIQHVLFILGGIALLIYLLSGGSIL